MSEFTVVLYKTNCTDSHSREVDTRGAQGVFTNNGHAVNIIKDSFSLSADLTNRRNGNFYVEENSDRQNRSFVMFFGWCYRYGNEANHLKEQDMIGFLQSHRTKTIPDIDELSGLYTLLSYDHLSETLWICTDMWAQHGFYYGSNDSKVVVSSKASIVAEALNASIDGVSYLSLLRDTGIPPGRTLYSDVCRVTCGRGLYLDLKSNGSHGPNAAFISDSAKHNVQGSG